MKILIVFDSFKGSMSSKEAGLSLQNGILKTGLKCDIEILPAADGGEGSLEMINEGKIRQYTKCLDPLGREISAYFLIKDQKAYIEMAASSGYALLKDEERNPMKTHTRGLGRLFLEAMKHDINEIILFAGGSATNDAGLGAIQTLGFQFYDDKKNKINEVWGENLLKIKSFEKPEGIKFPDFMVATDVKNPFYGSDGAGKVYGPQKGATPEMVELLEAGLKNIAMLFPKKDIQKIKGSGAAGGLAGGFHLFLNAKIIPATDILFKESKLIQKARNSDIIITGEGKIDLQTKHGKFIDNLLKINTDAKVIIIAGIIENEIKSSKIIYSAQLKEKQMSAEYSMQNASTLMEAKGQEIGYFLKEYFK